MVSQILIATGFESPFIMPSSRESHVTGFDRPAVCYELVYKVNTTASRSPSSRAECTMCRFDLFLGRGQWPEPSDNSEIWRHIGFQVEGVLSEIFGTCRFWCLHIHMTVLCCSFFSYCTDIWKYVSRGELSHCMPLTVVYGNPARITMATGDKLNTVALCLGAR